MILIDGCPNNAPPGEHLIVITRYGVEFPYVCYHPQLGPFLSELTSNED